MHQMYELVPIKGNTYYIYCPTHMLVYLRGTGQAVVVDTGNSTNVGKEVRKIIDKQGWTLDCIINTHAHVDHISGNYYLQNRYDCPVFASGFEGALIENTTIMPALLYGTVPPKTFLSQATYTRPSKVSPLDHPDFPKELEVLDLSGHSPGQIGLRTPDDVVFLADAYVSQITLDKYHISFIQEVKGYLDTLERLKEVKASHYLAAHEELREDITEIIDGNIKKTLEIAQLVEDCCLVPSSLEELEKKVCTHYAIHLTPLQHSLIKTTLLSHLVYLLEQNRITVTYKAGQELWVTCKG